MKELLNLNLIKKKIEYIIEFDAILNYILVHSF